MIRINIQFSCKTDASDICKPTNTPVFSLFFSCEFCKVKPFSVMLHRKINIEGFGAGLLFDARLSLYPDEKGKLIVGQMCPRLISDIQHQGGQDFRADPPCQLDACWLNFAWVFCKELAFNLSYICSCFCWWDYFEWWFKMK